MVAIEEVLVFFLFLGFVAVIFFIAVTSNPERVSLYSSKARRIANSRTLLHALGVDEAEFLRAKVDYSSFKIPKRTGGSRHLQIPNEELKGLQKKLLVYLTTKLGHRVSRNVHSYKKFRSIKTNAEVHIGAAVVIKLDIINFFPKISVKKCRLVLKPLFLTKPIEDKLVELVTTRGGLPQGAPTSPLLSNLVLREVDKLIWYYCWSRGYKYSRYADDITISLPKDDRKAIHKAISFVNHELKSAGFRLNRRRGKFHILRRHQAQRICGVTINSGKTTISRQKRRELRAAKHHLALGRDCTLSENQLQGYDAYLKMIHGVREARL